VDKIKIGEVSVSRFILGSNPFSGFSHQGKEMDLKMKGYYTTRRIKDTIREAERLGITTFIGRTDYHIIRFFLEYRDEGGKIQWFAQTCPEVGSSEMCIKRASSGNAKACHIHGGVMDNLLAQGKINESRSVIDMIRESGMLAGIAGHNPEVFKWAEENIDVDYYMCSYYNPIPRAEGAEHISGTEEMFLEEDRGVMTDLIQKLSKPVIHYKIMAAGRNKPSEAIAYVCGKMRPIDMVCIGVYTESNSDMLKEDVNLFRNLSSHI